MKKILSFLFCLTLLVGAFAQSTMPRYGTLKNQDNTGRVLNYKYAAFTDATGSDSVVVNPSAWTTIYVITLKDSFTLKQPIVTSSYLGDNIELICTATTGTPFLKFSGSNWITAGTATLSTGLRAVITLVFDGAKWVEKSRVVQ